EDAATLAPEGRSSIFAHRLARGSLLRRADCARLAEGTGSGARSARHPAGLRPDPLSPPLIAEIAGLDIGAAGELLDEWIGSGAALQLDRRLSLYASSGLGHPAAETARAHSRALRRLFAGWAMDGSECEADLPQLRCALGWAVSQTGDEAWASACDLGKRGD